MIPISAENLQESLINIERDVKHLDQKLSHKIMFIAEEIITNIIRHGDFGTNEKQISFNLDIKNNILTFMDNAKEFNMLTHPDPDITLDIKERVPGGLGIYLTKKYAKSIKYSYENGFNILKLYI